MLGMHRCALFVSVFGDEKSSIHEGPRFSLVHEGNFHCVDVAPVTVEDQGCWTCMAENRSGRSSCTSTLTVIVPKAYKRPEFVEELRALLTETGTVSLECKVVGVPTPVLRWFKDSKEIKAGDVFALTANADDPTSLGVYTCEANNCMGTTYSSSKVHVVGRGSREGSLKPADTLAPSGPLPVFKQMLRDECCRIGDTLVLSSQLYDTPQTDHSVTFDERGEVSFSFDGKEVSVSLYETPDLTEEEARYSDQKLILECRVRAHPPPSIFWLRDGQILQGERYKQSYLDDDVYRLEIANPNAADNGRYTCRAVNDLHMHSG